MTLDPTQISTIIGAIVTLLTALGVGTVYYAKKTADLKKIIADVADIVVNAAAASANGVVTPAEAAAVINDIKDIVTIIETDFIVKPVPPSPPTPPATS